MAKKRFQAEQIIGKLREAEVEVSKGQTIAPIHWLGMSAD